MRERVSEERLLKHFGLMTERQVAALFGITVPSLRNRPADKLPDSRKVGRRRLFVEESVRQFLDLPPAQSSRGP